MARVRSSAPPAPVADGALDRATADLRAFGGGIVKVLGYRETSRLRGGPCLEVPAALWRRLVRSGTSRSSAPVRTICVEGPDGAATTVRVLRARNTTGPCARLRGFPPDSPWLHDDYVGVTVVLVRPAPGQVRVHLVVTDDDREELGAWFGFELDRGALVIGELASPSG